jgi:hypothetical protein
VSGDISPLSTFPLAPAPTVIPAKAGTQTFRLLNLLLLAALLIQLEQAT